MDRAYSRYVEERALQELRKEVSKLRKKELEEIVVIQLKKIFDRLEPEEELSVDDAISQLKKK